MNTSRGVGSALTLTLAQEIAAKFADYAERTQQRWAMIPANLATALA